MAITRRRSVARDFACGVLAFRAGLPDPEDAIWTPEEQADYEVWERDFEKPSEDAEHDEWLGFMDFEISWAWGGREIPSS